MGVIRWPDNRQLADLVRLGEEMHGNSTYAHIPFSRDQVIEHLVTWSGLKDSYYVAVFERSGQVVGGMIGKLSRYWFADDGLVASDIALYVAEDARGGAAAKALIADFEAWAKSVGAKDVVLASTASHEPLRAAQLYLRLGYDRLGFVTRKVGA